MRLDLLWYKIDDYCPLATSQWIRWLVWVSDDLIKMTSIVLLDGFLQSSPSRAYTKGHFRHVQSKSVADQKSWDESPQVWAQAFTGLEKVSEPFGVKFHQAWSLFGFRRSLWAFVKQRPAGLLRAKLFLSSSSYLWVRSSSNSSKLH